LDVWWARLPQGQRATATVRVLVWWTCWCLAWSTSFTKTEVATRSTNGDVRHTSYLLFLGTTTTSCVFLALAAVALVLVVRGISAVDPNRR
ncbi:MAG: hypothetical protein ABIQ18_12300, partial [Umezawaea sp.]